MKNVIIGQMVLLSACGQLRGRQHQAESNPVPHPQSQDGGGEAPALGGQTAVSYPDQAQKTMPTDRSSDSHPVALAPVDLGFAVCPAPDPLQPLLSKCEMKPQNFAAKQTVISSFKVMYFFQCVTRDVLTLSSDMTSAVVLLASDSASTDLRSVTLAGYGPVSLGTIRPEYDLKDFIFTRSCKLTIQSVEIDPLQRTSAP